MESIEIVNFKSFEGTHIINNLGQFGTVDGTNGAGKSDFPSTQ